MSGTNFYADRGFVTINGKAKVNLKSVKWTIDESVTRVECMTADRSTSGYKKGNRKISGSMELEIPDNKAEIDLAFLYGNEVGIICSLGENGERHSLSGIVQTKADFNGSVGEASKTIDFEARTAVNENGPAVNSQIGF
jgi:hypothetical protein